MTFEAQWTLPYFTAIPTDVITNTWHFDWAGIGSPGTTDFQNMRDNLNAFYTSCYNTAMSMAGWCRPALTKLKVYDLDDPTPRVPVYTATSSLTVTVASTSTTTPETAICLSYQAAPVSGLSQASRRGRVYLGGFATLLTAGTTTTFPTLNAAARSQIASMATGLATSMTADGWIWVVYSRKLSNTAAVASGWIDDAPDTQRRRGQSTTVRTVW